jgi:AcrR family transcriptional regulator
VYQQEPDDEHEAGNGTEDEAGDDTGHGAGDGTKAEAGEGLPAAALDGAQAAAAPKRSMRADARRNRAKVLEVARQVFSTQGTDVPLDDIAELAGVGAGTVYRHFPTKESLIQAVLLSRVEGLAARARALAATEPPDRALDLFIFDMLYEGGAKRDLIDALIDIGVDPSTALAQTHTQLQRVMDFLLRRAQRAGTIRADIDADDLMALVTGVLIAFHRGARRPESAERSLAVLLDGLRCRVKLRR